MAKTIVTLEIAGKINNNYKLILQPTEVIKYMIYIFFAYESEVHKLLNRVELIFGDKKRNFDTSTVDDRISRFEYDISEKINCIENIQKDLFEVIEKINITDTIDENRFYITSPSKLKLEKFIRTFKRVSDFCNQISNVMSDDITVSDIAIITNSAYDVRNGIKFVSSKINEINIRNKTKEYYE